jgi:hypothetical protein
MRKWTRSTYGLVSSDTCRLVAGHRCFGGMCSISQRSSSDTFQVREQVIFVANTRNSGMTGVRWDKKQHYHNPINSSLRRQRFWRAFRNCPIRIPAKPLTISTFPWSSPVHSGKCEESNINKALPFLIYYSTSYSHLSEPDQRSL